MTLFSDESIFSAKDWPVSWDTLVQSDTYSVPKGDALPKNRPTVKHFWGSIRGSKNGHLYGRNHAISNQGDFHGWQHISMIVAFSDAQDAFNEDDIWVYEGITLPGNQTMMGRWSQISEEVPRPPDYQCGPFMFWGVPESTAEPEIKADDAWNFRELIDSPIFSSLPFPMSF